MLSMKIFFTVAKRRYATTWLFLKPKQIVGLRRFRMRIFSGRLGYVLVPAFKSRSGEKGLIMIVALCLCMLFALGTSAQEQGAAEIEDSGKPFAEFEAHGAGTGAFEGTLGFS